MGILDRLRARAAEARENLRLGAGAWLKVPELPKWWRQKDKTAERRAAASRVNGWLIAGCFIGAGGAAAVEVGFMMLFVLRAVGDISWTWNVADGSNAAEKLNEWAFALTLRPLLALLLFAASCVVVWFSIFWIPSQIALRGQGAFRRLTMVTVGLFCNAIIMVGSIIVQHENRVEDIRGAVVIEEQAAAGRAAIDARIANARSELEMMMNNRNAYLAQAASVGAAEWERSYVRQARATGDPRLPMLERALGAARSADAVRARIEDLVAQRAAAPVAAETSRTVEDEAGAGLAAFTVFGDAYRPVGIAVALSLIGILGAYWGFGLLQARALLDPTAPEEEAKAEAEAASSKNSASDEDVKRDKPPDPLDLPRLADWRNEEEPEFAGGMVDEAGRPMKRVNAHFRLDEKPAPRSNTDRRRAAPVEEEAAAAVAEEAPPPAADEDRDEILDEILDELLAKAQPAPAPEAEAETEKA